MKVIDFKDARKHREGGISPKEILTDLQTYNEEIGIDKLVIITVSNGGELEIGWHNLKYLEALGMLEVAKAKFLDSNII